MYYEDQPVQPTVQEMKTQIARYTQQLIARGNSGGLAAPIDENQIMQSVIKGTPSPQMWEQQDVQRRQHTRTAAARFWEQKGLEAKERWLNSKKLPYKDEDDIAPPAPTSTNTSPATQKITALQSLKPENVKLAYQHIFTDLKRWDDLPQATSLSKMKACFLSPERIGALVCSCLLMITLIAFVVILTL